ncbi:uncharacterized protein LOC114529321 [Dendronephthya gigantea]|uniref:uncharacterized protein LOC114529321 n=1 Tax=Dendronephthya gigantea TaxID=151771 RepID=UPI00106D793E|nr:uncharacterized protein LOC114529321 [Dendronephthya gigantea]
MYNGEDIIHTTESANLSVATGWLILSIALGSILTFTFFAAISTSFYCCQKPSKNDDKETKNLINQGNPAQKLFFPNVPTSVYPTTQSILQQEENEVIDSLTPAYRELPSTHFTYISSFNGSITTDQTSSFGNQQTTVYPNSTQNSILPHTSSDQLSAHSAESSEQLQRKHRQKNGFSSKINHIDDSSLFIHTTSSPDDPTTLQVPSPSQHHTTNDSSLSIHITNASVDPQMCITSATSGIITEEDLGVEAANENPGHILEPAMNRPASNDQQLSESAMNDVQLNKPATNDQRLCADVIENTPCNISCDQVTSHTECIANDSHRGASSFGGLELSPKTRAFSPDYYALTFRREGSGLSDISCSSGRGASAFANNGKRRKPIIVSPDCVTEVRGASAFEKTSEIQASQPETSHPTDETNTPSDINSTKEFILTSYNAAKSEDISKHSSSVSTLIANSAHSEVRHSSSPKQEPERKSVYENILFEQETRRNSQTSRSVNNKENERNSSILILRNVESASGEKGIPEEQNKQCNITSSSGTTIAKDKEPSSRFTQTPSKARIDTNRYKPNEFNSELNSCERMQHRRSITLTNNHQSITSNFYRPRTYERSKTQQKSSSDYSAPIKIPQNVSAHTSDPIKGGKRGLLNLNGSHQSLRGASQLGCYGDEVDGVCSDSDACWDSVSLSFAYESASDEDVASHCAFK